MNVQETGCLPDLKNWDGDCVHVAVSRFFSRPQYLLSALEYFGILPYLL